MMREINTSGCGNFTTSITMSMSNGENLSPGPEHPRFAASLILVCIGIIHLFWSILSFTYFHNDYEYLKQRQLVHIYLVAAGAILEMFVSLIDFIFFNVPSWF